jgi:hypothetical protein
MDSIEERMEEYYEEEEDYEEWERSGGVNHWLTG